MSPEPSVTQASLPVKKGPAKGKTRGLGRQPQETGHPPIQSPSGAASSGLCTGYSVNFPNLSQHGDCPQYRMHSPVLLNSLPGFEASCHHRVMDLTALRDQAKRRLEGMSPERLHVAAQQITREKCGLGVCAAES